MHILVQNYGNRTPSLTAISRTFQRFKLINKHYHSFLLDTITIKQMSYQYLTVSSLSFPWKFMRMNGKQENV